MRKFNFIILIFLCLGASLSMRAEHYTVASVPSPKERGQEFYVSNPDSVLSDETVAQLDRMLEQLDRMTQVELAVVAIDRYANIYNTTYQFTYELFNHWGIGKADKNTGVLVLLARNARDIQIITGSGIEGILTDYECDRAIDAGVEYLKEDDFDQGVLHICQHLSDKLLSDDNRAELLLGWKPEEPDYGTSWIFIVGFLVMALLSWLGYKRLNGAPGQLAEDIQAQSADLQTGTGCLAWIFPIPLFFLYLFYRYARKHVTPTPLNCSKCGQPMNLLTGDEHTTALNKAERSEEQQGSYKFFVWHCPECGAHETDKRRGPYYMRYEECPKCHARTMRVVDRKTTSQPSYKEDGRELCTYTCFNCFHVMEKYVILSRLERSYGHSSSSGGSYHSGGHHSSHRSGSFGGGRSSGGGSGRHF